MKQRPIFLVLCLLLFSLLGTEARAEERTGDVWDGSIQAPTRLVPKDGVTYYEITRCAELAYVAQTGGDWLTYNYILGNDLILNDITFTWDEAGNLTNDEETIAALLPWTPVDLEGRFDGNGYTVSGMYINHDRVDHDVETSLGLLGRTKGTIQNVTVVNSHVETTIAEDSYFNYIGGIIGSANKTDTSIQNCSFSGVVKVTSPVCLVYVGGVIGYGRGQTIGNLYNYGNIYASGGGTLSAGGVLGVFDSYGLTDSANYGAVSGVDCVGGIVAWIDGADMKNCVNYGPIRGRNCVGGLVGEMTRYSGIFHSCNYGSVTGEDYVGGIVGRHTGEERPIFPNLTNLFNQGPVSATAISGGILGGCEYAYLENAYSTGPVTGGAAGGIAGDSDHFWGDRSSIANCYYAKETGLNDAVCAFGNRSEDGSVAGDAKDLAEACTLDQLRQQATFSSWDFEEVWSIDPARNEGWPYLQWQTFSDDPVAVNGITLDQSSLSLFTGDAAYLTAALSPANATDKTVVWSSSAPEIAAVSSAGKVTALATGSAVITAVSGSFQASCTVTVSPRAANEYQLTGLTIRDNGGALLTSLPRDNFWATVAVKKCLDSGNGMVLLASYGGDGQYLGLYAARAEDLPTDTTIHLSFLLSNRDGTITRLKAFCVPSFAALTPLGPALEFPQ